MTFREDLDAIILSCLSPGPAHGYELCKRIRALSGDVLSVAEGKLYPVLHAIEDRGEIEATWVQQDGRPARKVYKLTETGRKVLERKRAEWQRFARGVGAVMQRGEA
jgi:DNA-binding PadR family transcriptional regulator